MTNEEMIEQLKNAIGLIKQDGKDWLDDRDIPILEACIKSLTALDKIRAEIANYQILNKDLMRECDMLRGNINRMMVTDDHEELLTMFAYAHHRLDMILAQNKRRINLKNIQEQEDGNDN